MNHRSTLRGAAAFAFAASMLACAATTEPPPAPAAPEIDWIPMQTGRSCARAEAACGVGNCVARVENRCAEAVECELVVQCVCQAFTGESGEALARARDNAIPGGKVGLRAHAICGDGEVLATHAQKVTCR